MYIQINAYDRLNLAWLVHLLIHYTYLSKHCTYIAVHGMHLALASNVKTKLAANIILYSI